METITTVNTMAAGTMAAGIMEAGTMAATTMGDISVSGLPTTATAMATAPTTRTTTAAVITARISDWGSAIPRTIARAMSARNAPSPKVPSI